MDYSTVSEDQIDAVSKAHELLNDYTHCEGMRNWRIAVNVKMHDLPKVDPEDILINDILPVEHKDWKDNISDRFDINEEFEWYLKNQTEYFFDWLNGCTVTSESWWRENVELKIQQGKKTGYTALDESKSPKAKLEEWIAKDKELQKRLNQVKQKEVFFFGRSGGWLSIDSAESLEDHYVEVKYALQDLQNQVGEFAPENSYTDYPDNEYFEDEYLQPLQDRVDTLFWLIDEIEQQKQGVIDGWKEEVKYQLQVQYEDMKKDYEDLEELEEQETMQEALEKNEIYDILQNADELFDFIEYIHINRFETGQQIRKKVVEQNLFDKIANVYLFLTDEYDK